MYEAMNQEPLYVVLTIVLICWIGIVAYLFKLDRKISKLEQQHKK
jgi:CcmD family protein